MIPVTHRTIQEAEQLRGVTNIERLGKREGTSDKFYYVFTASQGPWSVVCINFGPNSGPTQPPMIKSKHLGTYEALSAFRSLVAKKRNDGYISWDESVHGKVKALGYPSSLTNPIASPLAPTAKPQQAAARGFSFDL